MKIIAKSLTMAILLFISSLTLSGQKSLLLQDVQLSELLKAEPEAPLTLEKWMYCCTDWGIVNLLAKKLSLVVPSRTTLTNYSQIFFDLDRTLWDFDRNSAEALTELFFRHNLDASIDDPGDFINKYHVVNLELWDLYRKGEMTKDVLRIKRFRMSFEQFGINDDSLASDFGDDYLEISPKKTMLVPHTIEILDYLSPRYTLHIITNGFLATQQIKMKNCGLDKYFSSLTTSEVVGHNKPRPEIFHQALSSVHARKEESIMIGDDLEVDILGAKKYGIDQVFLNRDGVVHRENITHEINSLTELKEIL